MLGATGMLGRPVAKKLLENGFDVSLLSRDPDRLSAFEGAKRLRGDVFDRESLLAAFEGREMVYLNLRQGDGPSAPQPETDGLRCVIEAAKEAGVRRIAMISALVMNYQGMNGFHWWAFDRKREATAILKDCGLEWTIFYPSTFMDNFLSSYRDGEKVMLVGRGKHPQWFIAGEDYGAQVARSFEMERAACREYPVQGPEPLLTEKAAEIFAANSPNRSLRITRTPLLLLRILGLFNRGLPDVCKIVEALNEYPEQFQSETTWNELGRPQTTMAEFARTAIEES